MYRMSSMAGYSPYGSESTKGASEIKSASLTPERGGTGVNHGSEDPTYTMGTIHDPFVASNKPKGDGKLSATASTFQPFGLSFNVGSLQSTKLMTLKGIKTQKAATPMPGTAEYVKSIIAAEENSPRRGVPAPSPAPLVTKGGFFSTESIANRHIKVTGIFIDDVGVRVQQSLEVSFLNSLQ